MPTERRTGAGNRPALTQRQSVDFGERQALQQQALSDEAGARQGRRGDAAVVVHRGLGMETTCMIGPFDGQWPTRMRE